MSDREPEQGAAQITPMQAGADEAHWSYLLRVWRSGARGGPRASLQSIPAGERHMFADLHSLLAFLLDQPWPPTAAPGDLPSETSSEAV